MKRTLLFVITQFYRGGAETALVNLLKALSPEDYAVDLLVLNQTTQENSLLPEVPAWVRVLDAGAENGAKPFSMTKKAFWLGGDAALHFVAGRTYDAAFSYGEWCPLEFVAQNVAARTKAVWIHTDITKSNGFDANAFFDSFLSYRYYIFVSEDTKRRAEARYPFLIGKSALIHNVLDRAWLEKQAAQPVKDFAYPVWGLHLITVANVRTEKGLSLIHI